MSRAWMAIVSLVLGATAGWASYFGWQYRHVIGAQELLAALIGAAVGGLAFALVSARG